MLNNQAGITRMIMSLYFHNNLRQKMRNHLHTYYSKNREEVCNQCNSCYFHHMQHTNHHKLRKISYLKMELEQQIIQQDIHKASLKFPHYKKPVLHRKQHNLCHWCKNCIQLYIYSIYHSHCNSLLGIYTKVRMLYSQGHNICRGYSTYYLMFSRLHIYLLNMYLCMLHLNPEHCQNHIKIRHNQLELHQLNHM